MPSESTSRITTGQFDWSGGVDSNKPATIASPSNPQGLRPNQLQWAVNATMRGGGIQQRYGWTRRAVFPTGIGKFQVAEMYQPIGNVFPYIMTQIGGHVYRVRVDTNDTVQDLSASFDLYNPPEIDRAYMVQGERFMVIQAGDYFTLPLFWDGEKLFRSNGNSPPQLAGATFTVPNIGEPTLVTLPAPPATPIPTNQEFLIGGYRYRQVDPDQRYEIVGSNFFLNKWQNGTGITLNFTIPETYQLINNTSGSSTKTFLIPKDVIVNAGSGGSPNFNPMTFSSPYIFLVEDAAVTTPFGTVDAQAWNDLPGYEDKPIITGAEAFGAGSLSGSSGLGFVTFFGSGGGIQQNSLAVPAANELWLLNIDDPRAGTAVTIDGSAFSQLPAGGPMDYYQGRIWIANGRNYMAGDIVRGPNGTGPYDFTDSILNVTENAYLVGGGVFTVPDNSGEIRALKHTAQIDTATGDGLLFVFTRESIYSVNVPITRADWILLEEPIQRLVQFKYGTSSDWSVVPVNGDLFFQSVDGIRSLTEAIRYFGQWGNVPISSEEALAINASNRGLLLFGSGVLFDNRLIQTCLPEQTDIGVIHKGLIPLDFDLISTLQEKLPPAWEGMLEGLDVLQIVQGDFGGRERAFAIVRSALTEGIEVWELTINEFNDFNSFGESRVSWLIETPSFTWNDPFQLKQLETIELWIDRLNGTVEFQVWYRPSAHPCWQFWHAWTECSARSPCELLLPPPACDYPPQVYKQQYRVPMVLPTPEPICNTTLGRPLNLDYGFQIRILIKGFCRVRGLLVHALPKVKSNFEGIRCNV